MLGREALEPLLPRAQIAQRITGHPGIVTC
jgi:hypothetical protein